MENRKVEGKEKEGGRAGGTEIERGRLSLPIQAQTFRGSQSDASKGEKRSRMCETRVMDIWRRGQAFWATRAHRMASGHLPQL